MNYLPKQYTAIFTFFIFLFFSIAPIYSTGSPEQNEVEKIVRSAQQFYQDGLYERAIIEFEKALSLTGDDDIKASVYLSLSLACFKSGNTKKSEDILRKLFELDSNINIDEKQFDAEYSMMYKKVKAEYWFSIKTGSEQREKEDRKIIAKRSKKPVKKKTKLFSILLIGAVVVAAVTMALLFWKEGGDERRGYLSIFNHTDAFIGFSIGNLYGRIEASSRETITLREGVHEVRITQQGQSRVYTIEIVFEQTINLVWEGFDV